MTMTDSRPMDSLGMQDTDEAKKGLDRRILLGALVGVLALGLLFWFVLKPLLFGGDDTPSAPVVAAPKKKTTQVAPAPDVAPPGEQLPVPGEAAPPARDPFKAVFLIKAPAAAGGSGTAGTGGTTTPTAPSNPAPTPAPTVAPVTPGPVGTGTATGKIGDKTVTVVRIDTATPKTPALVVVDSRLYQVGIGSVFEGLTVTDIKAGNPPAGCVTFKSDKDSVQLCA